MSKELWASQMEVNQGLQKQIDLLQLQLTTLTGMVKDLLPLIGQVADKPCGKHCGCGK